MRRSVTRIALGGLITAAAVLVVGTLLGRVFLGADDSEARSRIETEVRGAFDAMTRDLQAAAAAAESPADVQQASRADQAASVAASRLFETTADVVESQAPIDLGLTLYGADSARWPGRAGRRSCRRSGSVRVKAGS